MRLIMCFMLVIELISLGAAREAEARTLAATAAAGTLAATAAARTLAATAAATVFASIPGNVKTTKPKTAGITTVETQPLYKIAIIDTGYDPSRATESLKLCSDHRHYDYHMDTPTLGYLDGHGTHVANLIAEKLGSQVDYCAEIFQVFRDEGSMVRPGDLADAIEKATESGVIAVNISLASDEFYLPDIRVAMEDAVSKGVTFFVAAGNHGMDLDKNCAIYPACFRMEGEIVVGAQDPDHPKKPMKDTNFGKQTVSILAPGWYDDGKDQDSGTSFAAPRALAEYILFLEKKRTQREKK